MSTIPRLAVGTFQPGADPQLIVWALMEALRRGGLQVQQFHSRACFPRYPGAASITGLSARHLDSWLMTPEICRQVFIRGAQSADLALVEGRFPPAVLPETPGGKLAPLCLSLDLPRIAILDVSRTGPCLLPVPPGHADALLLDCVNNPDDLARLVTDLEALWGVPVLGSLESLPGLRSQIAAIPTGEQIPAELCHSLGENLARHFDPQKLMAIASQRDFSVGGGRRCCASSIGKTRLTVAIAYDEAFNCYFPDTLDLLELRGASVVDFSPLRDEHLPPQVDIVYFGCGHPERYAAALSENHCMAASLRSHLCAGRRVYGEGGGAAYLCQQMETPDGNLKRMVGVVPAIARLARTPTAPQPVQASLARPNWLGSKGSSIRGYRNSLWTFEPSGNLVGFVSEKSHHYDLVGGFNSVGSLLHLNFAAQPDCFSHFFVPQVAQVEPLNPWTMPSSSI